MAISMSLAQPSLQSSTRLQHSKAARVPTARSTVHCSAQQHPQAHQRKVQIHAVDCLEEHQNDLWCERCLLMEQLGLLKSMVYTNDCHALRSKHIRRLRAQLTVHLQSCVHGHQVLVGSRGTFQLRNEGTTNNVSVWKLCDLQTTSNVMLQAALAASVSAISVALAPAAMAAQEAMVLAEVRSLTYIHQQ